MLIFIYVKSKFNFKVNFSFVNRFLLLTKYIAFLPWKEECLLKSVSSVIYHDGGAIIVVALMLLLLLLLLLMIKKAQLYYHLLSFMKAAKAKRERESNSRSEKLFEDSFKLGHGCYLWLSFCAHGVIKGTSSPTLCHCKCAGTQQLA